ncbi:MAG: hypothetical protein B6U94_08085 [Thermofilum sp. ex4484_79]|nr:MAG: hypothetical protein B6U94_08085 [Thermofilum sp. ex4484_79]
MLEITKMLVEAAGQAAEKLEQLGDSGRKYVKRGASGDLSLMGDVVSEDTIINYLKNSLDSFTVVTEEKGILKIGKGKARDYFVIDPIDGSSNYKVGLAPYTVSIAVSNSRFMSGIYSGVVYEASSGKYFWAEKNNGAYFLNSRICRRESRKDSFIVSINFSHSNAGKMASFLKNIFKKDVKIRAIGSASWEACLVAKGILDAYVEAWNRLRVVDIAAALLVLRESGIPVILDLENRDRDPILDLKERVSFIASYSDKLLDEILSALKKEH